jgi:multicomponent K+:H+ antiporter subunit E
VRRARPGLGIAVLGLWLVLNGDYSPGNIVLGVLLALALPPLLDSLMPRRPLPRHPLVALKLLLVFLRDVVAANLSVARLVLGPESAIRPGFVEVPLALRDPRAVAILAGIVTMTPGTISVDVSADRKRLHVHVLNLGDAAAVVQDIKVRYEAPLALIFTGDGDD